ncbi:MAG: hypothetical protein Tsb0034_29200 [Ekhidna sp.]
MLSDNEILKLILGFKIRHLRQKHSIPYQELSRQTGLSVSYLNDIEKGKKYPKPDKIRALATAFEVDYDELVGIKSDKKLLPVIDLLNSGFFKHFPADEFGFNTEKLIDFFSNAPDRISAFISTILKITRSYHIEKEHFYRIALRSYQDMHDNFFPELESVAEEFRSANKIKTDQIIPLDTLRSLVGQLNITIDTSSLAKNKKLNGFRSYFNPDNRVLYLNSGLSEEQERFLLSKEIGFELLMIKERAYETVLEKEASFEKLLNNFKASYFSAALLMPAAAITNDIKKMALATTWKGQLVQGLLTKYQVTPETLIQRFTNILPRFFNISNLFFIRLDGASDKNMINYRITKELHLSGLHKPYPNQLAEHLCHRWVSISSIKSVVNSSKSHFIDAQISKYWETDNAYFCISIAQKKRFDQKAGGSITLGLAMNETLKGTFNFIKDPDLKTRQVNTTCERCSMPDCDNRVAPATYVEKKRREEELEEALKTL